MPYKASAPGSMMLLGEYAVLHGKHALVCAVDKRISVTLTPREDDRINIQSSIHGHYTTDLAYLDQESFEKPFQFVLAALKHYQTRIKNGCDIHIVSEFSDKIGLGSSAAVTVAILSALASWLAVKVFPMDLVRHGREVVRHVQGVGSGADIAASVFGGMVGYQAQPLSAEKLPAIHPLTALYVGFKTPTVEAIERVQQYFAAHPHLFRHISNSIGQCALEGIQAVRKEEWSKLGEIMNIQQGMMESLGVSSPLLHELVQGLRQYPAILGAKISGSGLGDCVVGLGKIPGSYSFANDGVGMQHIPVTMTLQGVHCEKI